MDNQSFPRKVPAESGIPSLTPHNRSQLTMATPKLPQPGEHTPFLKGERHALAVCVPVSEDEVLYDVYDRERKRRYSEEQIRRWWDQATEWLPEPYESTHIELASEGAQSYTDAMRCIDILDGEVTA